jgi:hypothetical protein
MKFTTGLVLIGTAVACVAATLDGDSGRVHPLEQPFKIKNVHARACASRPYGCENGYCWDKCSADGSWCWLAYNGGYGDWITCRADKDCAPHPSRGAACGVCDDPKKCGCSC